MLAHSAPLLTLPNTISGSEGQLRTAYVSRRLRAAAAQLTRIEAAAPASLRPDFVLAASALMAVTFPARQTTSALNAVSAAFTSLGQEVQGPCGFPLG
jgi:hypothetical protein